MPDGPLGYPLGHADPLPDLDRRRARAALSACDAVILFLACTATAPTVDADRTVAVTVGDPVATVDERFLSFAVDAGQVAGMVFWNPDPDAAETEIEVDPYDFSRPKLRRLAQELSPAVLRVGGTDADNLWVDLAGDLEEPPDGAEGLLTEQVWDGVMDFAVDLDLQVMWTLGAGPAFRGGGGISSPWNPTNARTLVEHAASRGDPVLGWELANEPNAYSLFYGELYDPEHYGADLFTARALLDDAMPGALLAGPASAFWPVSGEFVEYVDPALAAAPDTVDVVTWHYYPQQSDRCPLASREATPQTMLDPANLDEAATWAAVVEGARDAHAADAAVWLGETGNAQCGGQPGVSDSFASTFWWVDQLGLLAARGQQAVARQTLSGADYALIDDVTLEPNPDWWASVLWKRVMGTTVRAVNSDAADLRAWGHCDGADLGLALINLSDERTAVDLDPSGMARLWVLEADDLSSRTVRINGRDATVDDAGVPVGLPGVSVPTTGVVLPARSVGFLAVAGGCG